ncbi:MULTISPECIES: hypothetical protein [Pseudomonas]|uniref:Uncharacterized protein n=2 Tax=Pseudomonas TaxID=286 RepID=A0A7V8EJC2_PSEPU|nr:MULTISPECIES: hypothetical protein [Pseudomonas]KAF0255896.1 hypothetical protein GN299_05315 [Pseudomonas putida]MDD1981132.1 hypothetical protein [Pseudomonas asiatica]
MDRAIEKLVVPEKVLRLHMEGIDELGGDVRLGSFIDKLSCLKAALAETESLMASGAHTKVDFVVSELSHSSPAMIGLRGIDHADSAVNAGSIMDELARFIISVRANTEAVTSDKAKLIGHLRKLASGVGERFSRIWIDGPGLKVIKFDEAAAKAFEQALPDTRREIGSFKGTVKRYSGINNQLYFKIVPPVGGMEIKCTFTSKLLSQAAAAVENTATVEGELKYYGDDFWPYEIKVTTIEIHPKDSDLPTLAGLAGSEPEIGGEQDAEDYVRELRSGW